MITLGYDIGSSSIKCAVFDCEKGKSIAHGFYPADEMKISSPRAGWAEQDPEMWWQHVVTLTKMLLKKHTIDPRQIKAIGISYQMHGLVLVDEKHHVLRPSIIWCDSRAVEFGKSAFDALGHEYCLKHLLNSPGNFTASKLYWVKMNEPETYKKIFKAMLPGEYIAMKLTEEISTTISGLSEGIYWDFAKKSISAELLKYYGIDEAILPRVHPTFSVQGTLTKLSAEELGLQEGTPITYRAGDQPNNAFSLNVLHPGEIAATAGTSGVVYGIIDTVRYDQKSRVNPFAHVNYSVDQPHLGVLLCINGTGILNSWLRKNVSGGEAYDTINRRAAKIPIGSEGLIVIPFGNGAERMLENKNVGSHFIGVDFNRHTQDHLLRAAQEGIAYSFNYGMNIMKEMGMEIQVIRAGHSNMFLSPIFRQTLANVTGATIQLYDTDGAQGAARGAAVGAGLISVQDVFMSLTRIEEVTPSKESTDVTRYAYNSWLSQLQKWL